MEKEIIEGNKLILGFDSMEEAAFDFCYKEIAEPTNVINDETRDAWDNMKKGFIAGAKSDEAKKYWYAQFEKQSTPIGLRWVKASERLPENKLRVCVKYKGDANVIYKHKGEWAFDDNDGMKVFPEDLPQIEWLEENIPAASIDEKEIESEEQIWCDVIERLGGFDNDRHRLMEEFYIKRKSTTPIVSNQTLK